MTRSIRGKNDSIFNRLPPIFTREQARQQAVTVKGNRASRNTVMQMLKNWRNQGLVTFTSDYQYVKLQEM